ncbi:von Willebrand factor D and EGF domain-containing protein-like isoform X2 [Crassostrea virginica]
METTTEAETTTTEMSTTELSTTEMSTMDSSTTEMETSSLTSTDSTTTETTTMETTTTTAKLETTTSIQGSTTPCDIAPVSTAPTLDYTVSTDYQKVTFDCSVSQSAGSVSQYAIWWYVGETIIKKQDLPAGSSFGRLESTEITNTADALTQGVSCGVVVSYPSTCGQVTSPVTRSSILKYQVTVNEASYIKIVEGAPAYPIQVDLTTSAQYYCSMKYQANCDISFTGKVQRVSNPPPKRCPDGGEIPDVVVESSLNSAATPMDATCGPVAKGATISTLIYVKAMIDRMKFGNRNSTLNIGQQDRVGQEVKPEVLLKKIVVEVKEMDSLDLHHCQSINDPHIRTFDGVYFDNFQPGEYLLYKNKDYEVEVRAAMVRCASGTCNCGVLVRSGDDVMRIDKCKWVNKTSSAYPINEQLFTNGELTPRTQIFQEKDGKQFQVMLPTGTKVTVKDSYQAFINIFIYPSAADFNKTEGLCGTYDGNQDNDLLGPDGVITKVPDPGKRPDGYSIKWRMSDVNSIFRGYRGTVAMATPIYCSCYSDGTKSCDFFGDVSSCGVTNKGVDVKQDLLTPQLGLLTPTAVGRRRKRQAAEDTVTYDLNYNAPAPDSPWPTNLNLTEEEARQMCGNYLVQSKAGVNCQNLFSGNYSQDIDNCVQDYKLTGLTIWKEDHLGGIQQNCYEEVLKDTAQWTQDANAAPSLPATITSTLCSQDCSNQGQCVDGICECNTGYGGADCSISVVTAPVILQEDSNVACDTLNNNCTHAVIRGDRFLNSSTLTCHMTEIQVNSVGISQRLTTSVSTAVFKSVSSVQCPLPAQKSYAVKISNDGTHTSVVESVFVLYQSDCYTCEVAADRTHANCSMRTTTCLIGGVCYDGGVSNPINSCQRCSPASSQFTWTTATAAGCFPPPSTTEASPPNKTAVSMNSQTVVIIASITAVIFLVICIVLATVFIVRYRAQRKKEKFMKRYETDPSVYNNGAFQKADWRPAYGDPTGTSMYNYQSSPGNVAFYDTRMALDDYFE